MRSRSTAELTLDAAVQIGDVLDATAFWHGPSCNWVGRRSDVLHRKTAGTHRMATTLPTDLYFGTAGLAWFLYQLYRATGERRYLTLCRGAIEHRPRDGGRGGLYLGHAGLGLVTAFIGQCEEDRELCQRGADLVAGSSAAADEIGLAGGLAGDLLACSILMTIQPSEGLCSRVRQSAAALISRSTAPGRLPAGPGPADSAAYPSGMSGMANGEAGIACALAAWISLSGRSADSVPLLRVLRAEDQNVPLTDLADAPGASTGSDPAHRASAWCQGAAGAALSRLVIARALGSESCQGQADIALRVTRRALARALVSDSQDFSLCHGFVGLAEVIRVSAELFDRRSHVDQLLVRTAAQRCVAYVTEISSRGVLELGDEDLSLMLGISGVGSFLLASARPLSPSPLLLTTVASGVTEQCRVPLPGSWDV
jgi:class II lanthipeptide synthase